MIVLWGKLGNSVIAELYCQGEDQNSDPVKVIALLRKNGEKRSYIQLMGVLFQVRQLATETIRSYSHRLQLAFRALTARQKELQVSVTDSVFLRDYFVEHLSSTPIRREIQERVIADSNMSFLTLRDTAIRLSGEEGAGAQPSLVTLSTRPATVQSTTDSLLARIDQLQEKVTNLSQLQDQVARLSALPDQVGKLVRLQGSQESKEGQPRKSVVCFCCGQRGHFARKCKSSQNNSVHTSKSPRTVTLRRPSASSRPTYITRHSDARNWQTRSHNPPSSSGVVRKSIPHPGHFHVPDGTLRDISVPSTLRPTESFKSPPSSLTKINPPAPVTNDLIPKSASVKALSLDTSVGRTKLVEPEETVEVGSELSEQVVQCSRFMEAKEGTSQVEVVEPVYNTKTQVIDNMEWITPLSILFLWKVFTVIYNMFSHFVSAFFLTLYNVVAYVCIRLWNTEVKVTSLNPAKFLSMCTETAHIKGEVSVIRRVTKSSFFITIILYCLLT